MAFNQARAYARARLALMTMTASDVVRVFDRLDAAGVDAWADGGWGVDALLGEQTRPHDDLDLILRVDDVPAMREALGREGFALVEGATDSNFVLRDPAARAIDVHPVRFDDRGQGAYRMANGEDWIFPPDGFEGRGRIDGREVLCLTADVQMLCHAQGYLPDEVDVADMRHLHARLGTRLLPPFDREPG
jgi:lincosamide nucleotidyltransferase A/C/D/E